MAPLFLKVGSNKLRNDVQNEETVICAKFGKGLFNISKVIGRSPGFLAYPVHATQESCAMRRTPREVKDVYMCPSDWMQKFN